MRFEANILLLSKEQGVRTLPILTKYGSNLLFDEKHNINTGQFQINENVSINPGENYDEVIITPLNKNKFLF